MERGGRELLAVVDQPLSPILAAGTRAAACIDDDASSRHPIESPLGAGCQCSGSEDARPGPGEALGGALATPARESALVHHGQGSLRRAPLSFTAVGESLGGAEH